MAVAAPPRSLHRQASASLQAGEIKLVSSANDASPGRDDPPFDAPPRPPRTGGGGGGGGDQDPTFGRPLPAAVWVVVAVVVLAVPAGFLAAACVHRGV